MYLPRYPEDANSPEEKFLLLLTPFLYKAVDRE